MTPEDARHVTFSFGRVFPYRKQLTTRFYDELFDLAPVVRPLFPADMSSQKEKLALTLHHVVTNISDLSKVLEAVRAMGVRHVDYGAEPAHYEIVGLALITALKKITPGGLSPEEERAWIAAYQLIAATMIEAAADAQATRLPKSA
ncbi:MAG: globin domain-containing protein [Pseudomonadota bacterium]